MDDFNNLEFGRDFAGGYVPVTTNDFSDLNFGTDFAGGYVPVIIPPPPPTPAMAYPSEYIAVPPRFVIRVQAEYRTIVIEPESLT